MITAAPGATFEATTAKFAHSATVGVRIRDNAGADFLARTVVGVTEDLNVGSSALFRRNFTAPTSAGQWSIVWDDGTSIDTEELVVTYTPLVAPTGTLYITRDEMKVALGIGTPTYADADVDRACTAVSRAIDEAVRSGGSHFYQATETRYYTPDEFNCSYGSSWYGREHRLEIEDLVSASSVTIDTAGDGTYTTTWTEGTDFFLDPANAAADGKPFEEIVLRTRAGRYLPRIQRAVKVTGTFGWPSVPPQVSQYAVFFVSQTVLRTRQAPFGILMQGMEVGATARLMRVDPDFDRFLGPLTRARLFI